LIRSLESHHLIEGVRVPRKLKKGSKPIERKPFRVLKIPESTNRLDFKCTIVKSTTGYPVGVD
jgi:hypothetical protein